MCNRLVAAGLFGLAAALLSVAYWALAQDTFVFPFAAVSVGAALTAGALAGPRLAADAVRSGSAERGHAAGTLLTLGAYVLGTLAFALLPVFTSGAGGGLEAIGGVLLLWGVGLVIGAVFLPPALFLGAGAGWLFYRLRLRLPHDYA